MGITSAIYQSKTWRQLQSWYKTGRSNECEKYQRALIENITGSVCNKTKLRNNARTLTFESIAYPMKLDEGFDYTEDFDGKQDTTLYNLKMVCDKGGAQTRTLREVYHFVECQLKMKNSPYTFVNILDGDCSAAARKHFNYLLNIYNNPPHVFVGDMKEFEEWHQLRIA